MKNKKNNKLDNKHTNVCVSVIMAVYNAEKFLENAIESILSQSLAERELIICDDCSTDKSREIAKQFTHHENIRLVQLESNQWWAAARNNALQHATGKYIAILDADDCMLSNRLEKQVRFLDAHEDIYLVWSDVVFIDNEWVVVQDNDAWLVFGYNIEKKLHTTMCIHHSTFFFRNEQDFLYKDSLRNFWEDYDFVLQILARWYRVYMMKDILVQYRIHPWWVTTHSHHRLLEWVATINKKYFPDNNSHQLTDHIALKDIRICYYRWHNRLVRQKTYSYLRHHWIHRKVLFFFFLSLCGKNMRRFMSKRFYK